MAWSLRYLTGNNGNNGNKPGKHGIFAVPGSPSSREQNGNKKTSAFHELFPLFPVGMEKAREKEAERSAVPGTICGDSLHMCLSRSLKRPGTHVRLLKTSGGLYFLTGNNGNDGNKPGKQGIFAVPRCQTCREQDGNNKDSDFHGLFPLFPLFPARIETLREEACVGAVFLWAALATAIPTQRVFD
jgi:hypothetical protein